MSKRAELQKEFEATGYTSWINSDLYPDGKIYTQEYVQWLEDRVLENVKQLTPIECDHSFIQKHLYWKSCVKCGMNCSSGMYLKNRKC